MLIHVTGARGLLGKEVVKALTNLGEVHGTDIDDMDVTDGASVMATFSAHPPEVLVHLAALKGNLPSRERPLDFFRVNTVGTINLLEACRRLGMRQFIFLSSLTVHGSSDKPVQEASPWSPIHPYGGSKGAAEAMVQAYANTYGLWAVAFRPNFIVGPVPPPQPYTDNIIYDFIQALERTGVIELAGDGAYQREWLHPRDVASAIALAVASPSQGFESYILSGHRVTMYELATRIIRRVGQGRIVTNPQRGGFSLISSDQKARQRLGWRPEIDLDTLIGEIWDEYQSRLGAEHRSNHRD
jgi:UDP-glucose 4-epimerase